MPSTVLVCLFLFIVFSPCLVAFGQQPADGENSGKIYLDKWKRPGKRRDETIARQCCLPEGTLSGDFEIRSFPKGVSQRRLLVRDDHSGVKLTIAQLRAAAVELIKIGGQAAAYEFALVAAASAAAMTRVKDAFAVAAREAIEAARSGAAWLDMRDAMTRPLHGPGFPDHPLSPTTVATLPGSAARWQRASQAA